MTEKLYEQNSLLRDCAAQVLACTAVDDEYLVELDRTVFFPEGGGQLSDQGYLDAVKVHYVSIKDGIIYHHCREPLEVGTEVLAQLDWSLRLDRMQQHCGEHLLSYACWKLFGANNVGFHMHEDWLAIDLDKPLSRKELERAELLANQLIWENREITVSYVPSDKAAEIPGMRKFNDKLQGTLRIVTVAGADVCTCCGTHPPATGVVGAVQLVKAEKHKEGIRVEFLCGRRALQAARANNRQLQELSNKFSTSTTEVSDRVEKLEQELQETKEKLKAMTLKSLQEQLQECYHQAPQRADGVRLVTLVVDNPQAGKLLQTSLAELPQAVSLVMAVLPERISYTIALGKDTAGDCREYSRLLNTAFAGRGGGKPAAAQGSAPFTADWRTRLQQLADQLQA